jgi:hypothetical protein
MEKLASQHRLAADPGSSPTPRRAVCRALTDGSPPSAPLPARSARPHRQAGSPAKRHAAGSSAQGVMTARPRRCPLRLMLKPSQAGVESACT